MFYTLKVGRKATTNGSINMNNGYNKIMTLSLDASFLQHTKIDVSFICGSVYPCLSYELVIAVSETAGNIVLQFKQTLLNLNNTYRNIIKTLLGENNGKGVAIELP